MNYTEAYSEFKMTMMAACYIGMVVGIIPACIARHIVKKRNLQPDQQGTMAFCATVLLFLLAALVRFVYRIITVYN